ncbi:MAG: response regulator [Bacteriovoracaceae bacterium]|nr:response regulator [Bacteriovoracaceae bacterium]
MGAAKIFLVDDNSLARKLSSNFIKKFNPEFDIFDVGSAKELFTALESQGQASEKNPIFIFADLNMPEINGIELTSWVKRHPMFHHIPITIMTAEDSDQEKQLLLKMGIEAYCLKPLKQEEIHLAIDRSRKKFMVLGGDQEELETGFLDESWDLLNRFMELLTLGDQINETHYKEIYRILHTIKGVSAAVGYPMLALFIHETETFVQSIMGLRCYGHPSAIATLQTVTKSMDSLFQDLKDKKLTEDVIPKFKDIFKVTLESLKNQVISKSLKKEDEVQVSKENAIQNRNETLRIKHESLSHLQDKLKKIMQIKVQLSTFAMQLGQEFFDEPFPKELQKLVLKLETASIDALEGLLKLRAKPISILRPFVEKMVSEVSATLNKEVALVISGDEYLEIDPPIIDLLQGGLGHIVKNCIDHGIEAPLIRESTGKTKNGTIRLEFKKIDQKNFQVILQDDGQGINAQKLRAIIIKNELMDSKMVDKLTDEQIYPMIFLDGLSTKDKDEVSEISGRGVGMSAVKQSIEDIGGSIKVKSTEGQGTSFEIQLPLFFIL